MSRYGRFILCGFLGLLLVGAGIVSLARGAQAKIVFRLYLPMILCPGCSQHATPTPTGTPTLTLAPTRTPPGIPTLTATDTATPTPTDTHTPAYTSTPTGTGTPTLTPTPTETNTPTETSTTTPTSTPDWIVERADNEALFAHLTDRSLRIDSQGRPHIAYGSDALYYARSDGAAWITQTVDLSIDSLVGSCASLALDAQDHPHIAYYDSRYTGLKYAAWDGSAWQIQLVDSLGFSGYYPSISIVLDPANGWPRIAYLDSTNFRLKYAAWDGSAWQFEYVTEPNTGGLSASLALDSTNLPHISFYGQDSLRYARKQASGDWIITSVDGAFGDTGPGATSLVIGPFDRPSIGYIDTDNSWLNYAAFDGTAWYITTIDASGNIYRGVSLALDPQGWPHLAYHGMKHAWFDGSIWRIEVLDDAPYVDNPVSLAIDLTGGLHVAYLNSALYQLRYGYKDTAWNITIVDQGGMAGNHPSIAIDSNGLPQISHSVSLGSINFDTKLVYTRHTGSAWESQTVLSSDENVSYASFALTSDDQPRIAYCNNGQVFYTAWTGEDWSIETVEPDTNYTSSPNPSIALDSQDRPHISYYYMISNDLRYAWRDDAGWHRLTVDSSSDSVGSVSSIQIDGNDRPHIAYYDGSNEILKYAWYDGSSWHTQVVDSQAGAGVAISLALNAQGQPRIAYQVSYGPVRYAWYDGASWHFEDVFLSGSSPWMSSVSLVLDAAGQAHLAFIAGHTYYAERGAGGIWNISVVDSFLVNQNYVSLALDAAGEPQIAFQDSYYGNLFHAALQPHASPPPVTPTPSSTPTSTITHTPTQENTPTSAGTATPTDTPGPSETHTATATATPTSTPSPTPTDTGTSTLTPTPTETLTETPTSTSTPTSTPDRSVLFAASLLLDGVDDYAQAPDSNSLDIGTTASDDFTIEAFVYVADENNDSTDVLVWKDGSYAVYIVFSSTGYDLIHFRLWGGGTIDIATSSTTLPVGWHHIAVTFDNEHTPSVDGLYIFLDGLRVGQVEFYDIIPGIPNTTTPLNVGGFTTTDPLSGRIEELRISSTLRYNTYNYTVPSTPFTNDADTRALWHFDEPAGSTSFSDSGSNGNTLTGYNGAQTTSIVRPSPRQVWSWLVGIFSFNLPPCQPR